MTLGLFDFRSYSSLQKPALRVGASAVSGGCNKQEEQPSIPFPSTGSQSKLPFYVCKETYTQNKDANGRQATIFIKSHLFISADRTDFDAVLTCKWMTMQRTTHLFPPHLSSYLPVLLSGLLAGQHT